MAGDKPTLTTDFEFSEKSVATSFDDLKKEADKASKSIGQRFTDAFSKIGIEDAAVKVIALNQALELAGKAAQAVRAVFKAIGEGVELVKKEEEIRAINAQFEVLANQSNIAFQQLSDGLAKAADGLVDGEDLLKSANKALIDLGSSAQALPEILDIARKSTAVFGGDLLQNFEAINRSIATGATKGLKQLGLIIDSEKVYKDYAASIGTTADKLGQAEKQQALLNAVIEKGNTAFKNIDPNIKDVTNELQRLNVAIGEVEDGLAVTFSAVAANAVKNFAKTATDALNGLAVQLVNTFGKQGSNQQVTAQIEVLKTQIGDLTKLVQPQVIQMGAAAAAMTGYGQQLEFAKKRLAELQAQQAAQADDAMKSARFQPMNEGDKRAKDAANGFIPDPADVEKQNVAFQQALIAAQQSNLALQQNMAMQIQDEKTRNLELDRLALGQIELLEAEHKQRLKALEVQYQIDKTLTIQQYGALVNQENISASLKVEQAEKASLDRRLQYQKERAVQMKSVIVGGLTSTLQDVGVALQKGENLFDAFGKGVVGIIGDLAIQLGQGLIAQGIALEVFVNAINTLLPGSGAAAAAAGVGLVIFGAALKASVGKGGGGSTSVPSAPTVTGDSPDLGSGSFVPDDLEPEKPRTTITLNVQGNIIPRDRQFALELTELVNDSFESQGTAILRQG